jgi:hypothetical protein
VFDGLRAGLSADRSQFYEDLSLPFYGANRPGDTVSQGLRDSFWLMSMSVGERGAYECIKAFSETDLTDDLKKIDVPTLIAHGDDDQIVAIGAAALHSSKIVKDATLKVYHGAPHGLAQTKKRRLVRVDEERAATAPRNGGAPSGVASPSRKTTPFGDLGALQHGDPNVRVVRSRQANGSAPRRSGAEPRTRLCRRSWQSPVFR